ncbi:MAG TPA: NTPase, partial [Candidatus Choladousia intestinigallinarum]|nr:NTPase [Candidatus Choladousia intestinigallinarum]
MNNLWEKIRKIRKKIFKGKPKSEYTSLAPVDEIENGEEYLKALDWALKKNKLKNIALSGPWGSGKSSIIETYLKHRKSVKKRAIRISMASFVASKKNKQGEIELLSLNPEEIEIGILKQLFYKVNYKKIPQSRYRKLHKLSRKYIWFCLMMFSLVVIIVTFIFFRDIFNSLLAKIKSAGNELRLEPKVSITLFIIFVAFLEAIISNLYRSIFSKFKVNVVKLPTDTTLGRNLDTKDSIFNKNMDEIVYFFEETKYRFIFFEDLDRLNNPMIFVQLRELNTLLNNYNSIKKPIVFIYAIKDDIFLGTDRTKFFDFIIPVIPIINSTNSGEIFLEKIKKSKELGYSHELSRDFILDIAPFVEDM